ncbi:MULTISPECIES: transglycosylase SLT domain-containing protein [unclassified Pseudomonas]|uniref:transglycosylase SLT domain-containing protein n=1 Tax=Pseudomonas TaxID=286 RepID=UPI0008719992|nr:MULTISPECIES: transglycosylase SLT domain-containing protein [unclassified Pseudomonas]MBD9461720.1 transglycosylase SLT domain-containing protein [Pseudomonas sp. Pdm06]SCW45103.1 Transglycosylase SLT domain-containing protein [Pseudomonas sp. NFACC56-3]SFK22712.1 Transglycosylase SLT domain-containing protein [Pseudomonas sp. NFACC52]
MTRRSKPWLCLPVCLGLGFGMAQAHAWCWSKAGQLHAIEPELLQAIAEVESGLRSDAIHHNRDGTRDIGLMQINSIHLSRLNAQGITEQRLLDDPCLSVEVGASVLAGFITRYGYNWTAVGAYNAGNSPHRQAARLRYARKVWQRYQVFTQARR